MAKDDESLLFAEVKSRHGARGFEQAVGPKKLKSMKLSARFFLQIAGLEGNDFRLALLYVSLPSSPMEAPTVEFIDGI